MKTTTYLSYNGTVTVTTEDRPIPTREEMAACARIIRDAARKPYWMQAGEAQDAKRRPFASQSEPALC